MSQYKITKARLAQIIKEEYQSLHEADWSDKGTNNPLMQNINRWSEEGKDIPLDQTVGRAERSDQLDAILGHTSTDLGKSMDVISYFVMKADDAHVKAWLDERGLMGGPGASVANRKDEAKKAKKDFDGDGKTESPKKEWEGSRDKAIKKAEEEEEEKPKKESLDSIRDLIMQELKNI
tara:strand:+ start:1509 stop:2042 length:534 start_codon:yes stop_codon:yes gene_type:complete